MLSLRVNVLRIVAVATVAMLTSCSSGWSCQKRYVNNAKPVVVKQHKPC